MNPLTYLVYSFGFFSGCLLIFLPKLMARTMSKPVGKKMKEEWIFCCSFCLSISFITTLSVYLIELTK